jgi:hypothetical protein
MTTDKLDPQHYTAQLLNVSLDRFAAKIRREKPTKYRLSIENAQGDMYRKYAEAIDAAADELLRHKVTP